MLTLAILARLALGFGSDLGTMMDYAALKAESEESSEAYRDWLETMQAEAYPCD